MRGRVAVRIDDPDQTERCPVELLEPRRLTRRACSGRDRSGETVGVGHDLLAAHRIRRRGPIGGRRVVLEGGASIELVVLPIDTTCEVVVVLNDCARRAALIRGLAHREHPMIQVVGERPDTAPGVGV